MNRMIENSDIPSYENNLAMRKTIKSEIHKEKGKKAMNRIAISEMIFASLFAIIVVVLIFIDLSFGSMSPIGIPIFFVIYGVLFCIISVVYRNFHSLLLAVVHFALSFTSFWNLGL